jgi:secreted PhoX family phosphatase
MAAFVVYMGDDERGEYMYKWVSAEPYVEGGDTSRLMVDGTLFVAVFDDDQTGHGCRFCPPPPA